MEKIYGLLRRDTLPHSKRGWEFSTEAHYSTYLKHIKSLNHLKKQNNVGCSILLARIYKKARLVDLNGISCLRLTPDVISGTTAPGAEATTALIKMNPAGLSQMYD